MKKQDIVFYGAHWCGDCRRSKKLLEKYKISFIYVDLEERPEAADTVTQLNQGRQSIPTIIFPDLSVLVEPSDEELEAKLRALHLLV